MRFYALIIAIILAILAAILGWNFGPHHCFSCLSVAIAFVAILTGPIQVPRV